MIFSNERGSIIDARIEEDRQRMMEYERCQYPPYFYEHHIRIDTKNGTRKPTKEEIEAFTRNYEQWIKNEQRINI